MGRYIIIDTGRTMDSTLKENLLTILKLHPHVRQFVLNHNESISKFKEVWDFAQDCSDDYDETPDGSFRGMGEENWKDYSKSL